MILSRFVSCNKRLRRRFRAADRVDANLQPPYRLARAPPGQPEIELAASEAVGLMGRSSSAG
jgi:hypothetical protein